MRSCVRFFIIAASAVWLAASSAAQTANLLFNFNDPQHHAANVSQVTIVPLWTNAADSGVLLSRFFQPYTRANTPSLSSGTFTLTNISVGSTIEVTFIARGGGTTIDVKVPWDTPDGATIGAWTNIVNVQNGIFLSYLPIVPGAQVGYVPVAVDTAGHYQWAAQTGSSTNGGNVTGPASSTLNHLAAFANANGQLLKDTGLFPWSLQATNQNLTLWGAFSPTTYSNGLFAAFGSGGGSGNVTGPGSSTVNNIAAWNSALGTVLKDSGVPFASLLSVAVFQTFTNTLGTAAFQPIESFQAVNANLTKWSAWDTNTYADVVSNRVSQGLITPAQLAYSSNHVDADNITLGIVPFSHLGTGGGGSSKFLREDNTFQTIPGGGDMLAANNLNDVASISAARGNLGAAASATTITVSGTALQIQSSAGAQDLSGNRAWTLSFPNAMTLPGTLNVTGNQTNQANLSVTGVQTNFGGTVQKGGVTNETLTASTLIQADANKKLSSIANGAGVLTNDASGGMGFNSAPAFNGANTTNINASNIASGTLSLAQINAGILWATNVVTPTNAFAGGVVDFNKGYAETNLSGNLTFTDIANFTAGGDNTAKRRLFPNGADRTIAFPVSWHTNFGFIPVITNGSYMDLLFEATATRTDVVQIIKF
jgi:hypothetical protein